MPEHLGDAGQSLDDMSGVKKKAAPPGEKGGPGYVTPKKKIKARHAPHPDRGGDTTVDTSDDHDLLLGTLSKLHEAFPGKF